jgi:hypothetical protein
VRLKVGPRIIVSPTPDCLRQVRWKSFASRGGTSVQAILPYRYPAYRHMERSSKVLTRLLDHQMNCLGLFCRNKILYPLASLSLSSTKIVPSDAWKRAQNSRLNDDGVGTKQSKAVLCERMVDVAQQRWTGVDRKIKERYFHQSLETDDILSLSYTPLGECRDTKLLGMLGFGWRCA